MHCMACEQIKWWWWWLAGISGGPSVWNSNARYSIPHYHSELVSWSLTSLFSTNMAISETNYHSETSAQKRQFKRIFFWKEVVPLPLFTPSVEETPCLHQPSPPIIHLSLELARSLGPPVLHILQFYARSSDKTGEQPPAIWIGRRDQFNKSRTTPCFNDLGPYALCCAKTCQWLGIYLLSLQFMFRCLL